MFLLYKDKIVSEKKILGYVFKISRKGGKVSF